MNGPASNLPRAAAVEQGVMPALPVGAYAHLNPIRSSDPMWRSYSADQMTEHARAAWNMGLNAGLLHAPAETATSLPELRDALQGSWMSGASIMLSAAAAGALHRAMTTPPPAPGPASEALQAGRVSLDDALASGELQQLKAEAHALAADGANWSMDVGCMFVLAMIERIESDADQQLAGYINPEDLPKLGQCRATLWATPQQADAVPVFIVAPAVGSAT